MQCHLWTICILLIGIETTWSLCPYDDPGLKKWSVQFGSVGAKDTVRINENVLLDRAYVVVGDITIEKGGSLVFADMAMKLRTRFILIRGSMIIGSEMCPILSKINITLYGDKDEYSIDDFGEKFIGVAEGGELEIHGQEKLSWTKLVKTVKGSKDGTHADQKNFPEGVENLSGLVLYEIDPDTDQIISTRPLLKSSVNGAEVDSLANEMETTLQSIPEGRYVGIAIKRRATAKSHWEKFFEILEIFGYGQVTGKLKLRENTSGFSAWAMLVKTGDLSMTQEKVDLDENDGRLVHVVDVYFEKDGKRYNIRSWAHVILRTICYTRASIVDIDVFDQVIEVADDRTSWKEGDLIVFLSTDLDWRQEEIRYVTSCTDCSPKEFTIDRELEFTHYGEIYKNVDMRGEVALLNRNIVIEGEPAANSKRYGGHMKFMKGFKNVHIEYAEFHNMGQQETLGRYPIHFHMCEDVDRFPYTNYPYLRGNSIHDSNARCITIHGTHGVTIERNFCYKSLGHGYFLEDGGEKRTVMDSNLGVGQTRGFLIPSDKSPTTFWITNPLINFRNNVAAGSDHTGIWFLYPDKPLGPSAEKSFMAEFEAQHTAITEFTNNVAHSNKKNGLVIDNQIREDGKVVSSDYSCYDAWKDPLDPSSGKKIVELNRITAYKNMKQNGWIAGGTFNVTGSSFSDGIVGLTFKGCKEDVGMESYMTNSVIVGESPNIGFPSVIPKGGALKTYPRSVPLEFEETPRQGFVFGWCPIYIQHSWFGGFPITEDYNTGALGFFREKTIPPVLLGGSSDIFFGFEDGTEGNRLFDGDSTDVGFSSEDVDNSATFRDFDGTVSSIKNGQIVKPLGVLTTEFCAEHNNWKLAVCPHRYGQVLARWGGNEENMIVKKHDSGDFLCLDKRNDAPFLAIVGGSHLYAVRLNGHSSTTIDFTFSGISSTDFVLIGVCAPRGADVSLKVGDPATKRTQRGIPVASLEEVLLSDSILHYYFDSANGVVYIKGIGNRKRKESDKLACLDDFCPTIRVKFGSGTLAESNCFDHVTFPTPTGSFESVVRRTSPPLPDPPANYGAGDTLQKRIQRRYIQL